MITKSCRNGHENNSTGLFPASVDFAGVVVWEEFLSLAAQNRESRIARFPESRVRNRQKFRSEKQKHEANRSKFKIELWKIDSELPSESQPTNA